MKKLETALLDSGFLDVTKIEQYFLQQLDSKQENYLSDQRSSPVTSNELGLRALNANYSAPEFT